MTVLELYTTFDRILDTLLGFTLIDLILRVDPQALFELNLGRQVFLRAKTRLPEEDLAREVLSELERMTRSYKVAERLSFLLNVGKEWKVEPDACRYCGGKRKGCDQSGGCGKVAVPAYAVFYKAVKEASVRRQLRWNPNPLLKAKKKQGYDTIYIGVSPYWSKGLRQWDGGWEESSTSAPYPITSLLYYGLANYVINVAQLDKKPGVLTQILFAPPLGVELAHEKAVRATSLVKRAVNIIYLEVDDLMRRAEPPILALPLILLGQLDLPAIRELLEISPPLSIIIVGYDMERGYPLNPRGYEEFATAEVLEFYGSLGPLFWKFRRMLNKLIEMACKREQFKARILDILIDLSMAIKSRNLSRFNDAILKLQSLNKEELPAELFIPCPDRKEIFAMQRSIISE